MLGVIVNNVHDAECRYAECHYDKCHYAECCCAECRYAECRYDECRSPLGLTVIKLFPLTQTLKKNTNISRTDQFC